MTEETTKRKPRTSSEVKRRYNSKVYASVTAQLPKELVARFKDKCRETGVSQAQSIKQAIEAYLGETE